ncbi:MAG: 30S ribosomal protein S17 [Deltaproteobacteria bacterium]|nr:30S ribosomal protein S17 [Deltaproteobacteria bacterium]
MPSVRKKPRPIRGVVVSDKMNKTRIIEIRRTIQHALYTKKLVRKTRLFIHDEKNESKIGDTVLAVPTRPLSRHKSFKLLSVVEKT